MSFVMEIVVWLNKVTPLLKCICRSGHFQTMDATHQNVQYNQLIGHLGQINGHII